MVKIVAQGEKSFSELLDSLKEKGFDKYFYDSVGNSYLGNCKTFEVMQIGRNYRLQTIEEVLKRGAATPLEYWNEKNLHKAPVEVLKIFFNKCWENMPDEKRETAHRIYEEALKEHRKKFSFAGELGDFLSMHSLKANFGVVNEISVKADYYL